MVSSTMTCFMKRFLTNSSKISSVEPLRVCVVGSGVAGFSTTHQLIKHHSETRVDILEKLPIPFGLIRYGVAPDHAEVKNCANHLTTIAELPNCRFIGNIALGENVTLTQLQSLYHAVVIAYGAEGDLMLDIPGEDLPGVFSSRAFFGWYNGLPAYKDLNPDLSGKTAVIIGQGNVALDVARILLTPTKFLERTDICVHALKALSNSSIKRVHLIGRQGPLQVAFSTKELRTMSAIPGCRFHSDPSHFNTITTVLQDLPRPKRRRAELMMKSINLSDPPKVREICREWYLNFLRTPVEFIADKSTGSVSRVRLEINKLEGDWKSSRAIGTGVYEDIDCSMAIRSIGYRPLSVEGVPYDRSMRTIPNIAGRVTEGINGTIISGLYCSGWVKTGPVGAILNTMSSAYETAENIIDDYEDGKLRSPRKKGCSVPDIVSLLSSFPGTFATSFNNWKLINEVEKLNVKNHPQKKPREKITSFEEMLTMIRGI